jgi:hypothetical protein
MSAFGRLLEDVITELVDGVGAASAAGVDEAGRSRVRPISVAFALPVEAHIETRGDKLVVLADVPRTRTRTAFDRPLGRLSLNVVTGGTE